MVYWSEKILMNVVWISSRKAKNLVMFGFMMTLRDGYEIINAYMIPLSGSPEFRWVPRLAMWNYLRRGSKNDVSGVAFYTKNKKLTAPPRSLAAFKWILLSTESYEYTRCESRGCAILQEESKPSSISHYLLLNK